jgi:hypothetical protein
MRHMHETEQKRCVCVCRWVPLLVPWLLSVHVSDFALIVSRVALPLLLLLLLPLLLPLLPPQAPPASLFLCLR